MSKKQLDFTVRPRAGQESLPADGAQWVRDGTVPVEGPQKRLTLNLPAELHTAFKSHCVREGVTIQDKVRHLIERELSPPVPSPERRTGDH